MKRWGPVVVWGAVGVAVFLLTFLVATRVFHVGRSTSHTISGNFTLEAKASTSGAGCSGTGGYDDLDANTQVTAKDRAGKLIAVGSLGEGTLVGARCLWTFHLLDVPDTSFYRIEVGHRGELSFSRADLASNGWSVEVKVG